MSMGTKENRHPVIFPEDREDVGCEKAFDFGYQRGRSLAPRERRERLPISKMYDTPERMAYYRGYDKGRRRKRSERV